MTQTLTPIQPKYPRIETEAFPVDVSHNSGTWHVFPTPLAAN